MSAEEAADRGYQLVPKWWPVAIAILSGAFGFGATWATYGGRLGDVERKADGLQILAQRVDERLARIEGKLGVSP